MTKHFPLDELDRQIAAFGNDHEKKMAFLENGDRKERLKLDIRRVCLKKNLRHHKVDEVVIHQVSSALREMIREPVVDATVIERARRAWEGTEEDWARYWRFPRIGD